MGKTLLHVRIKWEILKPFSLNLSSDHAADG